MSKKQKREYYMVMIKSNLGWRFKDFKGMKFEEIEAKFAEVWKQVEDFIPMRSKEEVERLKRKGLNLEKEQVKKQKSSDEAPKTKTSTEEFTKDKIKEIMQLVPVEDVYVQALQVKHPIIDWKVHSEGERSYWQIIRLGGSSACYQFFVDLLRQLYREDLNQLWALVKEYHSIRPASSDKEMELWVELKRMYEPDPEDQLQRDLYASRKRLSTQKRVSTCDDQLQASSLKSLTDEDPDLSFQHLHAVKRIIRYLRGTVNQGLWYPKNHSVALTTFVDADHTGCQDTRRIISGSLKILRERLISRSLKRQKRSKPGKRLEREQHLDFLHKELRRQREAKLGSSIRQISRDYKEILKKKLDEIMQYNTTLNQPQSTSTAQDKYKNYKCFQCKQLGHIVKFCPMDNHNKDMDTKTDLSNFAREGKESFKPSKPSVMLKYLESINFSTKCMIKGTDHANSEDILYLSNQTDKHICYKLELFYNIKKDFLVNRLENQRKFLFTYGIYEVLIKHSGHRLLVPGVHYAPEVTLNILSLDLLEKQGYEVKYENNRCSLAYMFDSKESQKFDEDKMRILYNNYIEDYFESLAQKNKSIGEDLIKIKENLYSTKIIPKMPTKEERKDRDCLGSYPWNFGKTNTNITTNVVQKAKGKVEHFGVKLEDTEEENDSQEQLILSHSTKAQDLQGMELEASTSRISDKEDSYNSSNDELIIIT
nr:ARID DNA-binding domain-containing protein [Tanacetum cinerariifolium]